MLLELRVENLLLLERAELRLAGGLNVLTGETGAGKTVLAHALDLLLGGRARSGIVRPGAREAYVEGVFALTGELRERLGDRLAEDADELVLARRISAEGRSRAYVGGRAAPVADLRDLASGLLRFYGQHEHRRLTLASAQLGILDGFCGPGQAGRLEAHRSAHAQLRSARAELERLREQASGRERELDLVRFELAEIEAAEPSPEEEEALGAERERLRHLDALRAAGAAAAEAIAPDSGAAGAAALLAEASAQLDGLAGVDPELDGFAERCRAALYEVQDLGAELRRHHDAVEAGPGRLEEVEERLALLERLKRKHGGTLAEVLEHAARCRARRDELENAEEALEGGAAAVAAAEAERARAAAALTQARRRAAPGLARAVRERLAELAMEGAGFEVSLEPRAEPGASGDEGAEFLIAPNAGVPAGPLREIASGGELSRVMLALMSVAAEGGGDAAEAPLLVFDEVDAGIGGHTARAVGERLRALAATHPVLCITHLPQVASLADRHFRVEKDGGAVPARAIVTELDADAVVGELVRMLGADEADDSARRHARELLRAA